RGEDRGRFTRSPVHPFTSSLVMSETIILFEDEGYRTFLPLVYSRPVFELRCGLFTARERVAVLLGRPPSGVCRPHLASVYGAGRWPLGLLTESAPVVLV